MSLRRLLRPKPTEYVSWEAAASHGSYADPLINEFRAARAAMNRRLGWLPDILESPLAWLSVAFPGHLDITDLGGATGELGLALDAFRPGVSYTVVENPMMVRLMDNATAVRFSTELPAKCDIFHTSSTLQYMADPYETFERACKSAFLAVAVVRNCFAEREIFTLQTAYLHDNGAGGLPEGYPNREIHLPHRTISEPIIKAIANSQGFTLVSRVRANSVPDGHEGYGADLVFLKL